VRPIVYYLVPAEPSGGTKTDSWEGKLKSIEKMVNQNLDGVQKRSSKRLANMTKSVERLQETVENLAAKANVVFESLEQTLDPNP